jgi:ketosteroid isomerase-like protein
MADAATEANRATAIRFVERLGRGELEARCEAALTDGSHYDNTYPFLFQFENGKIALAKEYNDTRHSTETVGALLLRDSRSWREERKR